MPADMAPSPITQMMLCDLASRSRATAIPRPAEMEVEAWAAPKGSYSLSARVVKRDGKLDHTETGAQMATRHRNGVDCFGTQFVGEFFQPALIKQAKVSRT